MSSDLHIFVPVAIRAIMRRLAVGATTLAFASLTTFLLTAGIIRDGTDIYMSIFLGITPGPRATAVLE